MVPNIHIQQLKMPVSPAPRDLVLSSRLCGHLNTHGTHSCTHNCTYTHTLFFKALPVSLTSGEWNAVLVNNPHIVILLFVTFGGQSEHHPSSSWNGMKQTGTQVGLGSG